MALILASAFAAAAGVVAAGGHDVRSKGDEQAQKCGFLHLRMSGESRRMPQILFGVPDGI
jgi:hypothetical protein